MARPKKKIVSYDLSGNRHVYESVRQAGVELKINPAMIVNVLKGRKYQTHGLSFEYFDEIMRENELENDKFMDYL